MAEGQVTTNGEGGKAYRAESLDQAHSDALQAYDITRFLAKVLRPREEGHNPMFDCGELTGLGHFLEDCANKMWPAVEALSVAHGEVRHG